MTKSEAGSASRHCYRCGKMETEEQPLQLLPGSTHITLCGACFGVVWGWHRQPAPAPPGTPPKKPGGEHRL